MPEARTFQEPLASASNGMKQKDGHSGTSGMNTFREEAGVSRMTLFAFLVVSAILLTGGGGTPSPISEMIAQLVALGGVAGLMLARARFDTMASPSLTHDRPYFVILALWVGLPLVQLIPMPAALWQELPGREALIAALESVDAASGWWPISLTPYRTIASFLALVPLVSVVLIGTNLPLRERSILLWAIVAVATVSALLGILQVSNGGPWIYLRRQGDFAVGLIANRNAHADFLLIALLALTTLAKIHADRLRSSLSRALIGALALYFALSVVMTGSRTGMLLLCVPIAHAVWLLRGSLLRGKKWRVLIALPLAGCLAISGLVLSDGGNVQRSLDRFGQTSDGRFTDLWPDTVYAIRQSWPIGTGMGSFVPVFESVEQLEVVDDTHPNRAHNDYLEIALEAGVAGIALVLATLAAFAWRCRTIILRETEPPRVLTSFAIGVVAILAVHSLVDYPLRSITLSAAAAVAIAMIFRPRLAGMTPTVRNEGLRTS